jgi:hypothetical protein
MAGKENSMSNKFIFISFLIFICSGQSFAQELPKTAVVLEKASVTASRQLVLWMSNPEKNSRDVKEAYTCPEETRGHYYSGTANVSLTDTKTNQTINTIAIDMNGETSIDLPYLIHRGYYTVPQVDKNKEGKPVIMNLKDYNADGKPFEFALFNAVACMGLETTLIGYSQKQDKVIQYPIELKTNNKTSNGFWADYLFGRKPNQKGVWVYQIDYRGRAGSLDKYEFHYDKNRETFYGKLYSLFEE